MLLFTHARILLLFYLLLLCTTQKQCEFCFYFQIFFSVFLYLSVAWPMHSSPSSFSPSLHSFLYDYLYEMLIFLCCMDHWEFYCLLSFLGATAALVSSASVVIYSMTPGTTLTCDTQIQSSLSHSLYGSSLYFSRTSIFHVYYL